MKTNFVPPKWMTDWQSKYSDVLVEGLTDGPTYVRLDKQELPTLDVVLAFRPLVDRISRKDIILGGKLAVFPVADTVRAEPATSRTMEGWLSAAYPSIEFDRRSDKRVGTIIASVQGAPYEKGGDYLAKFRESDTIKKLLDYIEATTQRPIMDRTLAARAIRDCYLALLPALFSSMTPTGTKVETSDDEGFIDGDKVVSLASKKALKAMLEEVVPPEGSQPN